MILPILAYGNPILKQRAEDFEPHDSDALSLIRDMFETMEKAEGIGLAAPQVGISKRIFLIDTTKTTESEANQKGVKKAFINPRITEESGELCIYEEGCLSIPFVYEKVKRKPKIKIEYFDENWQKHTEIYEGINARVIQHEYDHIEGILFIDRISSFKRNVLKGKLNKISKGLIDNRYKMQFNK